MRIEPDASNPKGLSSKLQKAFQLVKEGSVKVHIFYPSRRSIYTVVGRETEELIDPEKMFCSCKDFFYRAISRKESCYHLIAYSIAKEEGHIETIKFSDDEYHSFVKALLEDLLKS